MQVDWEALARGLGTIHEFGGESGGSQLGMQAIEQILGNEFFEQAVEHYVSGKPGFELARSVLLVTKPWAGMEHCYKIFKHSNSLIDRRMAIELLRVVSDRRTLDWIPEFLADPDPDIQIWGIGIIQQQLLWDLLSDDEVRSILESALHHHNSSIREKAALLLTPRAE
jgi:hypothetical protein